MPEARTAGVCLITGAARGIGAATALAAGRAGYDVCINYVTSAARAEQVRLAVEQAGGRAMTCHADVSREAEVERMFEAVDRSFGLITALVNNAGVASERHPFVDIESEQLRRVVEVNLLGTSYCIKAAIARMAKSRGGAGGAIVNLSSAAARTGGLRIAPYVAAKAGVEGLTRALAPELADEGIRINAVAPGIIATDQQPLDDAAWRQRASAAVPLGRLGSPEEVAQAILWLLSEEAAYVTGAVISVAGGR